MSVKRLYFVKKARKAQGNCSKCGDPINVGDPYRYWEPYFRSSVKVRRCMKTTCTPRPSERESSLMQAVLAAQEDAEDVADSFEQSGEDVSELNDAISSVNEAIQEVAQQYRDADDAFGGTGSTPNAEKADELEYFDLDADFEDFDESSVDPCEEHEETGSEIPGCDACEANLEEAKSDWRSEQAQALRDALAEVPA